MAPRKIIHQTPPEILNIKPDITLGELHEIRLKKFKDSVNANISELKLKKSLLIFQICQHYFFWAR